MKDTATDAGVQYHKEKKEEGVTILSAAISSRDEVIGVLRLHRAIPRDLPMMRSNS